MSGEIRTWCRRYRWTKTSATPMPGLWHALPPRAVSQAHGICGAVVYTTQRDMQRSATHPAGDLPDGKVCPRCKRLVAPEHQEGERP
jgi:hypothetical protein